MKIVNNIFSNEIRTYKNHVPKDLFRVNQTEKVINAYTDGSFKSSNDKILGYAFAIEEEKDKLYMKNGWLNVGKTKKNLGALYAETVAIEKAIEYAYKKQYNNLCIYTDNKYIVNTIEGNIDYINPVLNAFLNKMKQFLYMHTDININIQYIPGHTGHICNEIVNFYAQKARRKNTMVKLFDLKSQIKLL